MPFNGSGNFSIPNTFVYDTVIDEVAVNANFSDVATGLSTCLTTDGQSIVTANIPMAGYRFTNAGAAVNATDYARADQIQNNALTYFTASGTNTYTLSPSPAITAYAAGQSFLVKFTNANTGASTLNVNGLGAKSILDRGKSALVSGAIPAGSVIRCDYDGTQFVITPVAFNLLAGAGGQATPSLSFSGDPDTGIYNSDTNEIAFTTNGGARARINATGQFFVAAAAPNTNARIESNADSATPAFGAFVGSTSARTHFIFVNPNGTVGSISTNASVTAFNISSDENLKENFIPINNSGEIIDALEPSTFRWKIDGSIDYGFGAQRTYKVFPNAVTPGSEGTPETNPEYEKWMMDAGKFMPLVIAELKDLRQRVAALENVKNSL